MRNLKLLDCYRITEPWVEEYYGSYGDHETGCFSIKSGADGGQMFVIASSGFGWDHVSVSRTDRCPYWSEMSYIKSLFFKEDEVVMQLFVAVKDHINHHPYCLHMWSPLDQDIPTPPEFMIGSKEPAK